MTNWGRIDWQAVGMLVGALGLRELLAVIWRHYSLGAQDRRKADAEARQLEVEADATMVGQGAAVFARAQGFMRLQARQITALERTIARHETTIETLRMAVRGAEVRCAGLEARLQYEFGTKPPIEGA